MGRTLTDADISEFDDAVSEYKVKEKSMVRNFVSDIAELGGILTKQKDVWKPRQMWTKYCAEIGIHISAADAQIRFFEYCKDSAKKKRLMEKIDNWAKMTQFLALSERQKVKLLDRDFVDISSEAFKKEIDEIKEEDGEVEVVEADESTELDLYKKIEALAGGNPLLANPKVAAEALQKELGLTVASREKLEGLINLMRGIELISSKATLNPVEKKTLGELLKGQQELVAALTL